MKKFVILILLLVINIETALASWEKIENPTNNRVKIYIEKKYIKKETPYVTYTVRMKDKKLGNYINIIKTDCSDLSSAIIATLEYDSSYIPIYNLDEQNYEFKPIQKDAMLYNPATYACMSKDTYTKNVIEDKDAIIHSSDNVAVKILKGIGIGIGCIVALPVILLVMLFNA